MRSKEELRDYIRLMCRIYYNKTGAHYQSKAIRYFIDTAKKQLRGEQK